MPMYMVELSLINPAKATTHARFSIMLKYMAMQESADQYGYQATPKFMATPLSHWAAGMRNWMTRSEYMKTPSSEDVYHYMEKPASTVERFSRRIRGLAFPRATIQKPTPILRRIKIRIHKNPAE